MVHMLWENMVIYSGSLCYSNMKGSIIMFVKTQRTPRTCRERPSNPNSGCVNVCVYDTNQNRQLSTPGQEREEQVQ